MSTFWKRAIAGLVLCIILIGFIIWGGYPLLIFMLAISLVGMYEFYKVFKIEWTPLSIVGYLATITYYADLKFEFIPVFPMLLLGFMILLMFFFVFNYPKYNATQLMAAVFAFLYVTMMMSCIYRLRVMNMGVYLAFMPFICAWGSDTSAYMVGRKIGKHKMAPKLSPNKSIEGAIAGIVGAALYTWLYIFLLRNKLEFDAVHIAVMCGIAAVGAFVSMIGDLFASAIKRFYDIKDYGKLIPGHGGILDRFDSIIITAPIVYYLAYFLMINR